ncbi:MAG: hypothetical protein LBV08_00670 [Clostridiales bacterium]|jgi:hypothetical protein|nr:hypothetical protein [Clostridiales bacterium]
MSEFLTLIGQIFIIACIQSIVELFIDIDKRPYQARVMNIACFLGSLYLLVNYIATVLLGEIISVFKINF